MSVVDTFIHFIRLHSPPPRCLSPRIHSSSYHIPPRPSPPTRLLKCHTCPVHCSHPPISVEWGASRGSSSTRTHTHLHTHALDSRSWRLTHTLFHSLMAFLCLPARGLETQQQGYGRPAEHHLPRGRGRGDAATWLGILDPNVAPPLARTAGRVVWSPTEGR